MIHTIELGDERLSEMNASEKTSLVEQFVHVLKKKKKFPIHSHPLSLHLHLFMTQEFSKPLFNTFSLPLSESQRYSTVPVWNWVFKKYIFWEFYSYFLKRSMYSTARGKKKKKKKSDLIVLFPLMVQKSSLSNSHFCACNFVVEPVCKF